MGKELTSRISPIAIYAALFVVIILGIRAMSYIINILLVSIILTLMLLPAMAWLKQKGYPAIAAVTVLVLAAVFCLLCLVFLILWSIGIVMQDLPIYQEQLNARLSEIAAFFGTDMVSVSGKIISSIDLSATIQMIFSSVFQVGDAVLYIFFIGVTTCFMLLEAPKIPGRLSRFIGGDSETLLQINRMSQYIIDFMIVRTETNAVHGVLFSGSLWVMGVHGAAAWGLMMFVLGYIPYIGLILASVPAILFAYIQFGIWGAVAVIALVCALNLIVENPVFSYLASRRFEIPALIVILSVIFWGWLLGIPGMFFSVPITLLVLILFQCSNELRIINAVLGVDHLFEPEEPSPGPAGKPKEGAG